jgi:Rrf2 family iron-sulfur cluster assembly transcriptional regulator
MILIIISPLFYKVYICTKKRMFSKACEYGIRSCIYIATQSLNSKRPSIREIAKEVGSPEPFTAKILQKLVKNNIIESAKGPSGGFFINTENISKIILRDIVFSIDGPDIYKNCGLGMKECSEVKPCPIHNQFKIIKNGLKEMLDTTNLHQLTLGLEGGMTFLKTEIEGC